MLFWHKGTLEPHNKVESLVPTDRLVGFEKECYRFSM